MNTNKNIDSIDTHKIKENSDINNLYDIPESNERPPINYDSIDKTDSEMSDNSSVVPKRIMIRYNYSSKKIENNANKYTDENIK